jgi:hypothetical protein
MRKFMLAASITALAGCAVPLTPDAEKIRLVTSQQKERCERVKLVTFNQRLGPDKPGNAMKGALNEAAAAGANGFYVVSTSSDWAEGASVVGEALRCKS